MHGINKVVPQLLMFIQLFEMNCTYERYQVLVHNKIYYDSICPKGGDVVVIILYIFS